MASTVSPPGLESSRSTSCMFNLFLLIAAPILTLYLRTKVRR
jgi:hypothetical protein